MDSVNIIPESPGLCLKRGRFFFFTILRQRASFLPLNMVNAYGTSEERRNDSIKNFAIS